MMVWSTPTISLETTKAKSSQRMANKMTTVNSRGTERRETEEIPSRAGGCHRQAEGTPGRGGGRYRGYDDIQTAQLPPYTAQLPHETHGYNIPTFIHWQPHWSIRLLTILPDIFTQLYLFTEIHCLKWTISYSLYWVPSGAWHKSDQESWYNKVPVLLGGWHHDKN